MGILHVHYFSFYYFTGLAKNCVTLRTVWYRKEYTFSQSCSKSGYTIWRKYYEEVVSIIGANNPTLQNWRDVGYAESVSGKIALFHDLSNASSSDTGTVPLFFHIAISIYLPRIPTVILFLVGISLWRSIEIGPLSSRPFL